ncbi:hypothetical protein BKA64DRAFT_431088 [Cadophora sp. MPI-SDFR-AT-0126]|nr:hypothetical protein BKA64DRAFT_431088 [Leotiomycetes sp. MPI-SDFR-AT-0126]
MMLSTFRISKFPNFQRPVQTHPSSSRKFDILIQTICLSHPIFHPPNHIPLSPHPLAPSHHRTISPTQHLASSFSSQQSRPAFRCYLRPNFPHPASRLSHNSHTIKLTDHSDQSSTTNFAGKENLGRARHPCISFRDHAACSRFDSRSVGRSLVGGLRLLQLILILGGWRIPLFLPVVQAGTWVVFISLF